MEFNGDKFKQITMEQAKKYTQKNIKRDSDVPNYNGRSCC